MCKHSLHSQNGWENFPGKTVSLFLMVFHQDTERHAAGGEEARLPDNKMNGAEQ